MSETGVVTNFVCHEKFVAMVANLLYSVNLPSINLELRHKIFSTYSTYLSVTISVSVVTPVCFYNIVPRAYFQTET